jgi:hypothetical protein
MDAKKLATFAKMPLRMASGTKVNLFEQDGKVLLYGLAEEHAGTGVSEATTAEIEALEERKTVLRDMSDIQVELARMEPGGRKLKTSPPSGVP